MNSPITQQICLSTHKPKRTDLQFPKLSWTSIYKFTDEVVVDVIDEFECIERSNSQETFPELRFASYLRKLQNEAHIIQYQLACLSTLGGAYHLCNKPMVALAISIRQEAIGRKLGSTMLIVRAKVFQAVNLKILGRDKESNAVFEVCYSILENNPWLQELSFVDASKLWLMNNFGHGPEKSDSCST